MRKTIILIITVLLSLTFSLGLSAEQAQYETLFDLLQVWGKNGYPDYVCGVWSNDGGTDNLSVGIIDSEYGANGQEEILNMITNDDSVTFVKMEYSRNYLISVMEYIESFFDNDIGLICAGLYDDENKVKIEIHVDYIENAQTKEFIDHIEETFGNAIHTEFTNAVIRPTFIAKDNNEFTIQVTPSIELAKNDKTPIYILATMLAVLTITTTIYLAQKKKNLLLQTTTGKTLVNTQMTNKEIIAEIKSAELSPSASLDSKILEEIEKIK